MKNLYKLLLLPSRKDLLQQNNFYCKTYLYSIDLLSDFDHIWSMFIPFQYKQPQAEIEDHLIATPSHQNVNAFLEKPVNKSQNLHWKVDGYRSLCLKNVWKSWNLWIPCDLWLWRVQESLYQKSIRWTDQVTTNLPPFAVCKISMGKLVHNKNSRKKTLQQLGSVWKQNLIGRFQMLKNTFYHSLDLIRFDCECRLWERQTVPRVKQGWDPLNHWQLVWSSNPQPRLQSFREL